MRLLSKKQHDHAWWEARKGKVSGSNARLVMSMLQRGGETAERAAYKVKLVTEALTGEPVMDGYVSPEMLWGVENEDLARAAYEFKTGNDVQQVGFGLHDHLDRFGGSCDGLIGTDGVWEAKCPKTTTHVKWMNAGVVPKEHEPQLLAYLSITGRQWVDFTSFDPRLPERHQLFIRRFHRDETRIAELEAGVVQFLSEVDEMVARLEAMNPDAPQQASVDITTMTIDEAVDYMIERSGASV